MVFLRLEIRIFPREQVSSSPSIFRTLIGSNGERGREDASAAKKYVSFLLALEKPEDVKLGDLASMILDEWRTLRPGQEPLVIKKLLDDANPSVDLSAGMTVADVFVDRGKARADGYDQRAIVRVIQRPSEHHSQRFGSVEQDWESAVHESQRRRSQAKKEAIANRFSPIEEEDGGIEDAPMQDTPFEHRHRDFPLSSVEAHENMPPSHQEQPSDAAIPGTPPFNRLGSEELGDDSPRPQQRRKESRRDNLSLKRKQSPERNAPVKQPRLEGQTAANQPATKPTESTAETTTTSTPSPTRRRNIPAFASPQHRRPSASEKPPSPSKQGLGLGITKSPAAERNAMLDIKSSQSSFGGPLFPSSAPPATVNRGSGLEKSQSLQSAMRKNIPIDKSDRRRSVSFADANDNDSDRTQNTSQLAKTSQDTSMSNSGTPSSSQIVYPPTFSAEKIQKLKEEAERKVALSKEHAEQRIGKQDEKASTSQRDKARKQEEDKARKEQENAHREEEDKAKIQAERKRKEEEKAKKQEEAKVEREARLASRDQKDAEDAQLIQDKLHDVDTDSRTMEFWAKMQEIYKEIEIAKAAGKPREVRNLRKRIQRLRNKIKQFENSGPPPPDPPLPRSASKVKRSIPTTAPAASQGVHTSPSWSFGKPNSDRRPSVASNQSSGSQDGRSPSSGKKVVDTPEAKETHAPNPSAPSSQPSRSLNSPGLVPSVVIQSPQKRSEGANAVASTDEEDYEDVNQSIGEDDKQDTEEKPQEAQDQRKADIQPNGSAEEPAEESSDESSDESAAEPSADPAKQFVDDEAESEAESEDEDSEESEDDSDSGDSDDSDDSDDLDDKPDFNFSANGQPSTPAKRTPSKTAGQSSPQPPSSQYNASRPTLKGLILSQKAEQTERQSRSQPQPVATNPPERRDIFSPPSSSDSGSSDSGSDDSTNDSDDSDDSSNQGDILFDGNSDKMRKPYATKT